MPEISVIIPFKDRLSWVEEAVESVLKQSFQDFELILVDDGSLDDYSDRFEKRDNRIHYIKQQNRGPAAARNAGIQCARGGYIAFLDSDDLFLSEKLETQIGLMKLKNASFSHTSYFQIDVYGEILKVIHSGVFSGTVYPVIYQKCPIATPTVMVQRELLDELRFPENLRLAEDIILWARISHKTPLLGIDLPLTQVRIHGTNAAFDCKAQIEGINNIINDGVLADTCLRNISKRLIISNLNLELAKLGLIQKQYSYFWKHMLDAFIYAPINIRICHVLGIALLPKTIRDYFKQYAAQRRIL